MAKDVSGLYLATASADDFVTAMNSCLTQAVPLDAVTSQAALQKSEQAWGKCAALAHRDDILAALSEAVAQAGVAGERSLVRLLYLALTSRLTEKPVPVAVVGPSAGGKNHVLAAVLRFMPGGAYYALSSMSERALAYSEEPLDHRFLVIYELAGLNSDFATYLLRSLLSEQRIRYETVEKDAAGVLRARLIEREGPTGLILTTTRAALHPENATRMLTVTITDTPQQTGAVLLQIARGSQESGFGQWQALQTWLEGAVHRVIIPYAEALATMVPPVAVRLRRDFGTLLSLIEARAILHQATRERDSEGRIIAHLADYEAVRELVWESMSEGVEATVSATLRETVEAVASLDTDSLSSGEQTGVSLTEIGKKLNLDKSSASRRARVAASRGYLRNLESRRGRPARYVIGDPMPDGDELLPTSGALQRCLGTQTLECSTESPTSAQNAQNEGVCSVAPLREGVPTPPPAPDAWYPNQAEAGGDGGGASDGFPPSLARSVILDCTGPSLPATDLAPTGEHGVASAVLEAAVEADSVQEAPTRCFACHGTRFWRHKAGGGWICATCHAPPFEHVVRDWLRLDGEATQPEGG